MDSALNILLDKYRQMSKTEREKGEYFELLIKQFLQIDPEYSQRIEKVWTYSEWAKENEEDARDDGIDLVAQLRAK